MKVRPDKKGFILTSETEYEKHLLTNISGQLFDSEIGVGGDLVFRNKVYDYKIKEEKNEIMSLEKAGKILKQNNINGNIIDIDIYKDAVKLDGDFNTETLKAILIVMER